ncbi:MAG: ABC transporter ATP-binding protein [Geodermatophilaceae bacterium]|nr:ABC transporter ATP-binding protein [Geodermatophilaceae bacterium]
MQSHSAQREESDRFTAQAHDVYTAELAAARLRGAYPIAVDLFELIGTLGAVALGTWALADGRLTLGGLLAFLAYLGMLYRPIQELGDVVASIFAASAGAERVLELLDSPPGVIEAPHARNLTSVRGRVTLTGVGYHYPGTVPPVLADVTLTLEPGEVVALLGPSGVGKSTVAKLLARLMDPDIGAIRLDGHDLRDLTLDSVRDAVGIVLQETLVLDASVRDNLLLGRAGREAGDDQLREVLTRAGAWDFVAAMPGGLDARVGQKGRSLSGGQRQRLALARALLRDPAVLVLDEPTTGLDADVARRVLPVLVVGRTVLLITHDREVATYADRVVSMVDGKITELPHPEDTASRPCGMVTQ